jgi:hypothetical protein
VSDNIITSGSVHGRCAYFAYLSGNKRKLNEIIVATRRDLFGKVSKIVDVAQEYENVYLLFGRNAVDHSDLAGAKGLTKHQRHLLGLTTATPL